MVLLRFLSWLSEQTDVDAEVLLLHGGTMEQEFERFDARVLGGAQSRLWMIQRGLTNLQFGKAAAALAFARQGPTMWSHREVPLVLLNSMGSLPLVRFMPASSPSKVVLYVHELDDSFERTLGTNAWELLSPRVDHFITCSERVTEMLATRRGIPADRITEHPGFVDPPEVEPLRSAFLRRELGIPPEALVVGASGQPEWRKGPGLFVRLARMLTTRRPDLDLHFVWVGGPVDESPGFKLIHDIQRAGLADRFHLTGETAEPTQVMGTMDLFALTSREDPYPLTMLEAASLGLPIVSFDNGGATEFAATGAGDPLAAIVPYLDVRAMADTIVGLFDDPAARHALGQRARAHVLANQVTSVAAPRLFETLAGVEPRLARKWGGRRAVLAGLAPASPTANGSTQVVVVDADDRQLGVAEKLAVHEPPGVLHRALSAFVFDGDGRLLLQRRALSKYHFPGRWSNSCCTHPLPGESVVDAARRRTHEELGIHCDFEEVGVFTYRAIDAVSGLVEHEVDHVVVGRCLDRPDPDPDEVDDVVAVHVDDLELALEATPDQYTPWLPNALAVVQANWSATQTMGATTPTATDTKADQ
jgi:isopentenyl-diphosphate delta-isomerase